MALPSDPRRLVRTARTLAPLAARTARLGAEQAVRDAWTRVRPGASGASGASGGSAAGVELPAPDGVEQYARQVSATRRIAASPQAVVEAVADLDRSHEWLTLHLAWRGERPSRIETGAEFAQQIKLMDIPAQARWRVERSDA